MRVDHHLSDDEYQTVMGIWIELEKVIPFAPPQPDEGDIKEVEDAKEVVTMEMLQKALEKQKVDLKSEMLENLRQTQLTIIDRQREINQQLIEGLMSNLGKMLQAKLEGVIRPSITGPIVTEVNEEPAETNMSKEPTEPNTSEEREKPIIKSNVLLKQSPFLSKGQNIKYDDYNKLTEGTRREFTFEQFEKIPEMKPDKVKGKENERPHPNWVPIQRASTPITRASSPEEGEVLDYEEDWDSQEGEKRKRVRTANKVRQNSQCHNHNNKLKEIEIESFIDEKINERVNTILRERSKLNESSNTVNLTDRIQVEVTEKLSGTNRAYKLTANIKFEMFEDYLRSELKTKRLEYIIDEKEHVNVPENKLTDDKNRVRDIIINHIDTKYYSKIIDLKEPREIVNKLKEYKRLETRMTSVLARKNLYDLKFNPKKERAAEFWDKFEEKVKEYESVPDAGKMTEKEKRDIFMHAVVESVPGVEVFNCLSRQTTGKDVTYEGLKDYLLQVESSIMPTAQREATKTAMLARGPFRAGSSRGRGQARGASRLNKTRCYSCGLFGHMSPDCPSPGSTVCYTCKMPGHVAKNCLRGKRSAEPQEWGPAKQAKQEEQPETTRGAGTRGYQTYYRSRRAGRSRGGRGRGGAPTPGRAMIATGEQEREQEEVEGKKMRFSANEVKDKNIIVKFIADSGATEHLSNSKLIFETLSDKNSQVIKCANKEVDLKIEGSGDIKIRSEKGRELVLNNVLYSKELSENLLSLRQFVDQGLQIFLDNKRINIYDPKSKERIMSGIYQSPFWIVKLKVISERENSKIQGNALAFVAKSSTESNHNTRSKDKLKLNLENKEELGNEISKASDLLTTVNNRKVQIVDSESEKGEIESRDKSQNESESYVGLSKTMLWHLRLSHASNKYLIEMTKIYPNLPDKREFMNDKSITECETCFITKSAKLPFGKIRQRAERPLQIIHADTMGPISPASHPSGFKFVVVFIDDFSRTALAYPIKQKTEVPKCLRECAVSMRNVIGSNEKICFLRCDQGTEFTGKETKEILKGINDHEVAGAELQLACPDTPEHNGVAERFNRTLETKVRSMMHDSGLPSSMWDLAVKAAVYTYNRTPHKSVEMNTPMRKIAPNQNHNIEQFKRFGCVSFFKIPRNNNTKFGEQALRGFLVGYTSTGYVIYAPEQKKLFESRHVKFVESKVYKDVYPKGENAKAENIEFKEFNTPERENILEQSSVEKEGEKDAPEGVRKRGRPRKNQALITFSMQEEESSEICTNEEKEETDVAYHALLAKIQGDPQTYREAINSPEGESWKKAIESELNSLREKRVFEVVARESLQIQNSNRNILDSRWIFKRKVDESGNVKFKARLVIRGFKDKNDYNLRETYAPVSRLALVRSFLAIANKYNLHLRQLDVETAFLYGEINEDIYMEIPEGVVENKEIRCNNLWKLCKSLYGLKISSKRWNVKFTQVIESLGFKSNYIDPCLFLKLTSGGYLVVLLYVDDILLMGNESDKIELTVNGLSKIFAIKDMGQPKEFLGIKIERDVQNQILKLSQEKFINNMLEKFGFGQTHPVSTPMVTTQVHNRERKNREESEKESQFLIPNRQYREVVGSLLYLANCTRPDISYAVNILSRHQIKPTSVEWNMAKRVLQYLSGTRHLGLTYRAKSEGMVGFSDASWSDCKNSLTTCGFVIRFFGDSVAWKTHKQSGVALSTCEAEYVAMSEACQQLMSLHNSVNFILRQNLYPMTLYCDNMAAITCSQTNGGNKLRHVVERRYHYVKDCVEKDYVQTIWIASKEQLADIFTKALERDLHYKLTYKILNRLEN